MAGVPLERLCIHQVTLMQCGFADGLECLARHGVPMTAIWHEKLEETGVAAARRVLADTQVEAVALCVGGTMAIGDAAERASQIELTRRRVEFCAELGIESLLMLTGGLGSGETDLLAARLNALEGFDTVVPEARAAGVRLVLEPLHPMVCGFRSVISTLSAACDFLDELDADDATGVALDTYALWWDLNLPRDIRRAAPRLRHFHVSDWLAETTDLRLDRGMPGDGLIDNRAIRRSVEDAGFRGPVEIEIFSKRHWWRESPDEVVSEIVQRTSEFV